MEKQLKQSKLSFIILFIAICVYVFSGFVMKQKLEVQAERLNCSSVGTFEDAQKLYNSDPVRYKALDRDHDGIACESLKK